MSRPVPHSIDEYLAALRAALSGSDPALSQDALYDAEEYLRAEAAASPGVPEAEVLERVMNTYGSPEEIAASYRDTEVKVKRALQPPVSRRAASPDPVMQFFSVYSDPRAYTSLFFMILSLVTGTVYFTIAVTGLSLSLGLAILIIGLPVFIGFIGIARAISLGEGRLLEAVTGERMPRRPVHPGPSGGLWQRILGMLQDGRTWTTIAYLVMMLPLGAIYFSVAITGLSVGIAFLLVPLVGMAQRSEWWVSTNTAPLVFSPWWLDTPMGWIFSAVFGALVLTLLLHFARFVVRMHARAAKVLLVT